LIPFKKYFSLHASHTYCFWISLLKDNYKCLSEHDVNVKSAFLKGMAVLKQHTSIRWSEFIALSFIPATIISSYIANTFSK